MHCSCWSKYALTISIGLYLKKLLTGKYHSICRINGYLNLSKQSPKYEKSNTKILLMKKKPFRNHSKSKISLG